MNKIHSIVKNRTWRKRCGVPRSHERVVGPVVMAVVGIYIIIMYNDDQLEIVTIYLNPYLKYNTRVSGFNYRAAYRKKLSVQTLLLPGYVLKKKKKTGVASPRVKYHRSIRCKLQGAKVRGTRLPARNLTPSPRLQLSRVPNHGLTPVITKTMVPTKNKRARSETLILSSLVLIYIPCAVLLLYGHNTVPTRGGGQVYTYILYLCIKGGGGVHTRGKHTICCTHKYAYKQ